jgi:hypothetical protein
VVELDKTRTEVKGRMKGLIEIVGNAEGKGKTEERVSSEVLRGP